jgi:hypothetical protein
MLPVAMKDGMQFGHVPQQALAETHCVAPQKKNPALF